MNKIEYLFKTGKISKIVETESNGRMKKFSDILDTHFENTAKFANNVSMRLFGIKVAGEKQYTPLNTLKGENAKQSNELGIEGSFQRVKDELNPSELLERKENAANPLMIRGAFENALSHLDNIAHYVGFAEPVHKIETLFNSTVDVDGREMTFESMMKYYNKKDEFYAIKGFLDRFKKVQHDQPTALNQGLNILYRNLVKSVFPFRISTIAKQAYHVPLWVTRINYGSSDVGGIKKVSNLIKELAKGTQAGFTEWAEIEKEMKEKRPDIYEGMHVSFTDPDLFASFDNSRILQDVHAKELNILTRMATHPISELKAAINEPLKKFSEFGLLGTRGMDNFSRIVSWKAAKEVTQQAGFKEGTPEFDKFFNREIDEGIYGQQPTTDVVTKPGLYADKQVAWKSMLLGTSVENKLNQIIKKSLTWLVFGDKETVAKAGRVLFNTVVVNGVLFSAIDELPKLISGQLDQIKDDVTDPKWIIKEVGLSLIRKNVLIAHALSLLIGSGLQWDTPMIKAFGAIGKQIGAAIQAQIDEDDDGRNEAIRGVGKASLKLLPFLGIPENSIEQLVKMAQARIDQIQSE